MEPSNTAPRKKKRMPLWAVILTDVLLIGTVLIVFALFHHVLPQKGGEPVMVVTTAQSSAGETTKAGDTTSPAFVVSPAELCAVVTTITGSPPFCGSTW